MTSRPASRRERSLLFGLSAGQLIIVLGGFAYLCLLSALALWVMKRLLGMGA
jgi:hypothetical protein